MRIKMKIRIPSSELWIEVRIVYKLEKRMNEREKLCIDSIHHRIECESLLCRMDFESNQKWNMELNIKKVSSLCISWAFETLHASPWFQEWNVFNKSWKNVQNFQLHLTEINLFFIAAGKLQSNKRFTFFFLSSVARIQSNHPNQINLVKMQSNLLSTKRNAHRMTFYSYSTQKGDVNTATTWWLGITVWSWHWPKLVCQQKWTKYATSKLNCIQFVSAIVRP